MRSRKPLELNAELVERIVNSLIDHDVTRTPPAPLVDPSVARPAALRALHEVDAHLGNHYRWETQ